MKSWIVDDLDLLEYAQFKFVSGETLKVAGQKAKIVALSKGIDEDDTLTITISMKPLRIEP